MVWACLASVVLVAMVFLTAALGGGYMRHVAERQALARADLAATAAAQQSLRMLEAVDNLIAQAQLGLRLRQAGQTVAAETVDAALRQAVARGTAGVTQVSIVDRQGLSDGPPTDRGTLRFARAVADNSGHFQGFAVVALDPMILSARLARQDLGVGAKAMLVQLPQGQMLADTAAAAGFFDRQQMLAGPELELLEAGSAGHARLPAISAGRDGFVAFRRLPEARGTEAILPGGGALAVAVVLDAATELQAANRQRAIILAAGSGFALLCVLVVIGRAMALRRRYAREALAAAWRQVSAVKAVRAELEQLLISLPVAAYQARVTPEGRYERRYVSPMLAHMTGWPMAALADAAQWESRLEEGSAGRLAGFFASVLHDGEGMVDYRMRRPDGGWIWLRERARVAARLPNGGGEVIGTIADVSAEGELALQAAMTSKLAMLGEMASGMAHELNQPVTVIGLAADRARDALAAEPPDMAAAHRALATITAQSGRCGEIIDQLRLFGRADAAPVGPVHLREAVAGALVLAEGPLRDADVTLRVDLPDGLAPVLGRLVQVEQVLVNLCMNARDALRSQPEDRRELTIAAEAEGERVRLRVSDTGGGIAAAVMSRLFHPFITSKQAGMGSGLGLSICQRLMREMNGDIAARNADGGAVFTLTFQAAMQGAPVLAAAMGEGGGRG